MDKTTLDYVVKKTHELMEAPTCSSEAKQAAKAWLNSIGTQNEKLESEKYIAELLEDIMPIDNLIAFAKSDKGISYFGKEKAEEIVIHATEIKAKGAKYCDCPACLAAAQILEKKAEILK